MPLVSWFVIICRKYETMTATPSAEKGWMCIKPTFTLIQTLKMDSASVFTVSSQDMNLLNTLICYSWRPMRRSLFHHIHRSADVILIVPQSHPHEYISFLKICKMLTGAGFWKGMSFINYITRNLPISAVAQPGTRIWYEPDKLLCALLGTSGRANRVD